MVLNSKRVGLDGKEYGRNIWKEFSTVRAMRHWNKLPREAGEASSLEALKVKLDRALSCGLAEGVPASGREPELPLKIPANPKHFVFLLPHC